MKSLKNITGDRGRWLAKVLMPHVKQALGMGRLNDNWKYDVPCEINFTRKFVFPKQPVVYYWIRQDRKYIYAGYALYHRLDYTNCPFGKLVGGQHKNDFEGFVVRAEKFLPHHSPPYWTDIVCVCHHTYPREFHRSAYQNVWVEEKGHGIKPTGPWYNIRPYIAIAPTHWRYLSMDRWTKKYWQEVTKKFAKTGVKTPKSWADGKFWERPDLLFTEAEI